eukprot:15474867-Alexandrium_andersonii.AAC.1
MPRGPDCERNRTGAAARRSCGKLQEPAGSSLPAARCSFLRSSPGKLPLPRTPPTQEAPPDRAGCACSE